MPTHSARSLKNLANVHPLLRVVADQAILTIDFTVVCGVRGKADQEKAFKDGFSNARYGQSPHNWIPALGFDAYLNPIDVHSESNARKLGEAMKVAAVQTGVLLKWGGDYLGRFKDLPHFELWEWPWLQRQSVPAP